MRYTILLAAGALIAAAVLVFKPAGRDERAAAQPAQTAVSAAAQAPPEAQAPAMPDDDTVTSATFSAAQLATEPLQDTGKVFQLDGSGKLILDEQARLNMEALFARTDREDVPAAIQGVADSLPPEAAARARDLLERYDTYQQAQRQAYPPGVAPPTEEAALAELDGLHALRVAHFGPDVAQALYGAEEALARSLVELMRLEKDQSLTMEEKAVRAEQLRSTMPEITEIERRNREEQSPR